MRVTFGDSLDLGIAIAALITEAIDRDDLSRWAAKVIDTIGDPPLYIYTMLDLDGVSPGELREGIGFVPSADLTEDEFQYLREISVRRLINKSHYLAGKRPVALEQDRKDSIDRLLNENFGIDPDRLPTFPDQSV